MSKYQQKSFWCGPASIQNALRAKGYRVGQGRIADLANTGEDGTDEDGVMSAIRALGYEAVEFGTNHKSEAITWVNKASRDGMPALLCVDNWGHWVCVGGNCGDRLWVIDSIKSPLNQAENGLHCLATSTLVRRWRASRKMAGKEPKWYAIGIRSLPPSSAS